MTLGPRTALILVLAAFLVLATLYNATTPIYESPDELQHMAYVAWLADGRSLPEVSPEEPGPWRQEGTGPPLYYWLVARLVRRIPHPAADQLAAPNPYANVGDPLRPGNKNVVLHDPQQENWPYRGSTLFVHLARALSTLMAVGTLLATFRLGRLVVPDRPGVALAMTALVAFTPQFLFLGASANNDNLVILISSWTLVMLVGWLRAEGLPNGLQLGAMGVLLGLAALSKASGLLLWPLAAGTLAWLAWQTRRWRWLIAAGLAVFLIAAAVCGWWFARNARLYADVTGIGPHLLIIGRRLGLPAGLPDALAEFRGLRYSFWLLFGWFSILAPEPFYWVMDGLTIFGLAGYAVFLFRSLRYRPRWIRTAHLLLIAWFGLVAGGLVRWTLLTPASQGRLLYPALAALSAFLVVGWAELLPQRLRRPLGVAALLGWGAWAALCPVLFLKPAYALPQRPASVDDLVATPSPLQVRLGDCCELVGYFWSANGQDAPPGSVRSGQTLDRPIRAGDQVPLTLVWRALSQADRDYALFVHATLPDGQVVGRVDSHPGSGMYPTGLWKAGELIVDPVLVPIAATAVGPSIVHFEVGLYDPITQQRLPAVDPAGGLLGRVVAGDAALVPRQWPPVLPGLEADTLFGQQIRLASTSLSQSAVQPGETVTVTLRWEALGRVLKDYSGFVHLVDASAQVVAQDDHPPLGGRYPTHVWFPGTVVDDPYRLDLPGDLPAGVYTLWGGFHLLGSLERLPAVARRSGEAMTLQPVERWKDDLVLLGTLTVTGP